MATNDTVVWAVNGPVETDARQARELAWIATGGQTGTIGPESLEVKAQATPDGSVRVLPGSFVAQATPNDSGTAYASAPWQSYMRAIYQTTSRNITPTDSSGSRADLIGIEIVDPQFEGTDTSTWGDTEWGDHAFWRVRVMENVSPDAEIVSQFPSMNRPLVPLARLNIPASTATITDDMITDLRFLAVERSKSDSILQRPAQDYTIENDGTHTNLGDLTTVTTPQWANEVRIGGEVLGAAAVGGDVQGYCRLVIQHEGEANYEGVETFFSTSSSWDRFEIPAICTHLLQRSHQGRPLNFWFQIEQTGGTGHISIAQTKTAMRAQVSFAEVPTKS